MSTLVKVVLATGGVAGIGGGGVLVYKLNNPSSSTSIRDLFSTENTKVLLKKNEDTEAWIASWKSYKSKDVWKLNKGMGDTVPIEFKNKCVNLLNEKESNKESKIYSEFLFYCSRNKTIKDRLSDEGRVLVGDEDSNFWNGKFDEYKKDGNQKKIPSITIASSELNSQADSLNKLKNGCKLVILQTSQ